MNRTGRILGGEKRIFKPKSSRRFLKIRSENWNRKLENQHSPSSQREKSIKGTIRTEKSSGMQGDAEKSIQLGWPESLLGFSIRSYRKSWMNFLVSHIRGVGGGVGEIEGDKDMSLGWKEMEGSFGEMSPSSMQACATGGQCLNCAKGRAVPRQMEKPGVELKWRFLQCQRNSGAKSTVGSVEWLTAPVSIPCRGALGSPWEVCLKSAGCTSAVLTYLW